MFTQNLVNFNIKVKKADESLLIEIEDQVTGDLFTKNVHKDQVKSLSDDPFFDLETIYHILQNTKNSEKETLSITEDGKLSYSCQVLIGTFKKNSGFTIDLEKHQLDPQIKLQKSFNSLTLKMYKMEEENTKLKATIEEMIKQNDERFQNFEKIMLKKLQGIENSFARNINLLEKKIEQIENPDWCFDPNGAFASKYSLSENNKIAIAKETTNYILPAKNPLPSNKKSKFTFEILEHNWMMVGIIHQTSLKNREAYGDTLTVGYANDGNLYPLGGEIKLSNYIKGDRISFEVDLEEGKVCISKDSKFEHEKVINKIPTKGNFYPFIYTNCQIGAGAKFV